MMFMYDGRHEQHMNVPLGLLQRLEYGMNGFRLASASSSAHRGACSAVQIGDIASSRVGQETD